MNSYIFEWHQKYGILITKFVIEKIIRIGVAKKQTDEHKVLP